jgi:hypothetical protein
MQNKDDVMISRKILFMFTLALIVSDASLMSKDAPSDLKIFRDDISVARDNLLDVICGVYHDELNDDTKRFIEQSMELMDKFAMVIRVSVTECDISRRPISITRVACAGSYLNDDNLTHVNGGVWIEDITSEYVRRLASYESVFPLIDPISILSNEKGSILRMISGNNVIFTLYVRVDGCFASLIYTNGFLSDYSGRNAIINSGAFIRLYDLLDQMWDGQRSDFDKVLMRK